MRIIALTLLIMSFSSIASVPKGITWYEGSVEKAMKIAKKENKPLFLYWGAVWCPPCNKMKKTVFSKKLFKDKIKKFVAVYLDGDHPRAQIYGDKFAVKGYPTMLILSPQGKEINRLPIGVPVEKYVSLMDISLKKMKSMKEILTKAMKAKKGKGVTLDEWKLLAGYSWVQDDKIKLEGKEKIRTFKDLYEKVPTTLKKERSRFFFLYLSELLKVKNIGNARQIHSITGNFERALKDQDILLENFEDITYGGYEIVNILYSGKLSARKSGVYELLLNKTAGLRLTGKLNLEERLLTFYPSIKFYKEKGLPKLLKKELIEEVMAADKKAKDEYTRQDAMSTAIWLLKEAHLTNDARAFAEREIRKSHAPYYFMSYLSNIENEAGQKDKALSWKKKAWESSKGHATRFQWGTSYILGIIEYTPNSDKILIGDSQKIFAELLKNEDAFSGRNGIRLKRLGKKLKEWGSQKEHQKSFDQMKKWLNNQCKDYKEITSCRKNFKEYGLI